MGASKGTYDKVLELLGNIEGKKVLDCGAGKGSFTEKLINKKGKIFACDINTQDFKLKIPFKKANFNKKIPFPTSFFDKVVSVEVIEHLENCSSYIKEINRITKTGGKIVLTTPNIQSIKSKLQFLFSSHFHWFQKKEFGDNGSQHIHPIYFEEIIFLLEKYGFHIDKITTNRKTGYTLFYTERDNVLKKTIYFLINSLCDIFYIILSVIIFPKNSTFLFGDILIIKATKK